MIKTYITQEQFDNHDCETATGDGCLTCAGVEDKIIEIVKCIDCADTGECYLPAQQIEGRIVDSSTYPCHCTIKDESEDIEIDETKVENKTKTK